MTVKGWHLAARGAACVAAMLVAAELLYLIALQALIFSGVIRSAASADPRWRIG